MIKNQYIHTSTLHPTGIMHPQGAVRLGIIKGVYRKNSQGEIFDTSICQVKFRKPRILMARERFFDEDRELSFDHSRRIQTRLQGVVFRKTKAIGFRNIGVSNIEKVSDKSDWPEVEPAKGPESLVVERDSDWNDTWGRDHSYEETWGAMRDRDPEAALFTDTRVKPQLTYYDEGKLIKDVTPQWDSSVDPNIEKGARKTTENKKRKARKERFKLPVYEVVEESSTPIIVPPSAEEDLSDLQSISPKDRKRAFAFNEYGLALMESGQYDRAMTYFKKARGLDPNEKTYRTNQKRCQQWIEYKSGKGG
jgi:tetratricopeptide (TPR) repeat protein